MAHPRHADVTAPAGSASPADNHTEHRQKTSHHTRTIPIARKLAITQSATCVQQRLFVNNIRAILVQQVCNGEFRRPKFRIHGGSSSHARISSNRSSQRVCSVGGGFVRPLPPWCPVAGARGRVRSDRVARSVSTDPLRFGSDNARSASATGVGSFVRFGSLRVRDSLPSLPLSALPLSVGVLFSLRLSRVPG